ncbi:MAG TPA: TIGR03000 domain-containing protein [Gemmataceae bacterium]|jgi:uncharacterized protein (TIGR03000 family)|nr:TIGR03000 domain-containing protein [Gemmataceae bacterium]
MYSVVLLLALSGSQPLTAEPPRLYGDGGIPWSAPANQEFADSLNAVVVGTASAAYAPPSPPALAVSGSYALMPSAAVANPIQGPTPARLLVRLPADARLFIDGEPTRSPGDARRFVSPPLAPGRRYVYVLRAEVVRDGRKHTQTHEITVRAGGESEVTLTVPAAQVAER